MVIQGIKGYIEVDEQQPLWPSLVTRQISLKSEEAKSPKAIAAQEKELAGHRRRGTWDEDSVTEFIDLMKDPTRKEIMMGRIFGILGNKNDQSPEEEQELKYRAVFQGSKWACTAW